MPRRVKASAVGGDGGDGPRFRAGQNMLCKISHPEPGGYAVLLPKYNLAAFLPTEGSLNPGQEVLAQFVCVSNGRILLQARFGFKRSDEFTEQSIKPVIEMNKWRTHKRKQGGEQILEILGKSNSSPESLERLQETGSDDGIIQNETSTRDDGE